MAHKKRPYQKKDLSYWSSLSNKNSAPSLHEVTLPTIPDYDIELIGDSWYDGLESTARSRFPSSGERDGSRSNLISSKPAKDRFKNIDDGLLPFDYSKDSVSVTDAIVLCQKAYFNVSVFKSTVDLLSEFTDSEVYLDEKSGSEISRKFIEKWFEKINIDNLKEQSFREYYRSGNLFLYKLDARLKAKSIRSFLGKSNAASIGRVPIRYIVLNPSDICIKNQLSFGDYVYGKTLTPFEVNRLKKRQTDQDKELYSALPKELQQKIDNGGTIGLSDEIVIPLSGDKINFVFYKKQDYEPMAVPMGFAVLDDINKKLELKKMDQAICRSVENVILLITMGAEPDKGGINHKNIGAMQEVFKNKSVGRVLVADYTTKGEFLIPDLKKVMGKEKYEVLNKDIEEGLANILLGESKYADTELKLKIFFQRLEEARNNFLRNFLQPEIELVCREVGLRDVPVAKFKKIDTINSSDLQRLITRMIELGILTPEQGMDVIDKGVFPKADRIGDGQDKYVEERRDGKYVPLVGGVNLLEQEMIEKQGGSPKKTATTSAPSGGRPVGTGKPKESSAGELYSSAAIMATTEYIREFESKAQSIYKEKLGLKRLTKKKKELIAELCESIIVHAEREDWEDKLHEVTDNLTALASYGVNPSVLNIAGEHGLSDFSAALLYHSSKLPK